MRFGFRSVPGFALHILEIWFLASFFVPKNSAWAVLVLEPWTDTSLIEALVSQKSNAKDNEIHNLALETS